MLLLSYPLLIETFLLSIVFMQAGAWFVDAMHHDVNNLQILRWELHSFGNALGYVYPLSFLKQRDILGGIFSCI